ncbi:sigma-70 family RNA polymerase sigma factor [Clostridium paraputrificum]|uniref:sigma-70 family RNA polymerase sigma factor n=1 Tax=Clostridium paraputrificum TaxID=29363 RepID=UPI000DCF7E2A|nr:sigma-70 family RNA polymerase sigma factor [Clostridium paraputrificum]MDU4789962.1 sigma-70 family RNA polymerase sigma factor [Clostridium sp.]
MDEKVNMAIKGDVQAFSSLIDSIKDNLYRTAYAYVKCKEDALDIVGDTIYKAFISIDKLRNPKLFKTWITRILINNAITFNKKRGRVIYLEEEALGNMEAMKEDSDEKLYLLCAIDKLDERYKEVIILKYFDDLTINEISKVLDKPEGTIKTYLNKGLNALRLYIGREIV